MAKCGKEILLVQEGTEQLQRYLDALNPGSVKLNDLNVEEWMKFAFRFAKHVNYFGVNNSESALSNWEDFFKSEGEINTFLQSVETGNKITPHLALFVSFLKLLELTQNRFNNLTKRHLDFYYKEILKIEKLPATPDQVHVIFELAKNSLSEKISKNTELDGGKDSNGKKLIYKTTEELIANKINVAQLKNVYNDLENSKIKAASVANSYDGLGGDFPNKDIQWWAFGYFNKNNSNSFTSAEENSEDSNMAEFPNLSDAKLGFALSSEILELNWGLRNIKFTIDFLTNLKSISLETLKSNIEIYCSGEKKWLGPFTVQSSVLNDKDQVVFSSGLSSSKKRLTLAFQIPKEEDAVVNYDAKILGESFNTKLPVCRVIFKTEDKNGHALYQNLVKKEVSNIAVNVDVNGIKTLELESDIGTLNPEKPFYPFGTQPVRKSNFYINYPELFKKKWKNLELEIEWKNTPEKAAGSIRDAFVDLYFAYRTDHLYQASSSTFLTGMLAVNTLLKKDDSKKLVNLFPWNDLPDNLIVTGDEYFKAEVEINNKEEWITVPSLETKSLFTEYDNVFKTKFSVQNNNYETYKNGPVRLSLLKSFLHELFPRIYALALISEDPNALIPNAPYTPFVESITLNYSAESSLNLLSTKDGYEANKLMLFHEHPFGQSEEHPYLRQQLDFIDDEDNKNFLVPTYCKGGELYIGLENVEKLQQVSLLVQVLEGSENPEAESFTGNQKVEWSVLCSNKWKKLDSNYLISNETDNFLKSGIVKFSIPAEATSTNTLLPEKLFWVKAKIHKNYDAVCKVIDIAAQSVLAEFSDNDNNLLHLEKGLEAETISKLVQRVSTVKSVAQPFSSFKGKPQESDEAYYQRISERLRHKNRAITIWDYEHIILQQFPEIHKVKCLNHTKRVVENSETISSFLSPGNTLIIVIPNIVDKNVFDIYQPRVSKATLNAIQTWVNKLNTLHVNAVVINPDYEEVEVELKVKFRKGFDENYYIKVLEEDITKLLSPWAFEKTASIKFGATLHRSVVINYIEELEYVDYVADLKLKKGDVASTVNVTPSSPTAILVSAKSHDISTDIKSCNGVIETEETCQT